MNDILKELAKPFHPSNITWKPGAVKGDRALALAYADLRAYMTRLDEVCGADWSVEYEPWGVDRIICKLTIGGSTRSSTGEMGAQDEKNEIGGTVAEAQSFKRACAMFGLGRYLYNFPSGWADIDPNTKQFTDAAKAKLSGMVLQHYRRATDDKIVEPGASTQATSETDTPPTPEELAIINQWSNRTEAEMWAVMAGACKNEHHARESMNKSIAKCGGTVTKENYICVYVDFLRHQQEKLAQQPQAA